MTTIKIMQPVMQEIEVSKEELLAKLLPKSESGITYGTLVYVNRTDAVARRLGYKPVCNALGVVTSAAPSSYDAMGRVVKSGQKCYQYTVNHFDCNNCVTTGYFYDDEVKSAE